MGELTPPRTWAEAYEASGTSCQSYGWWDAAITDFTAAARMWERVAQREAGDEATRRAERCWRRVAECADRRGDELGRLVGEETKSMEGAPRGESRD